MPFSMRPCASASRTASSASAPFSSCLRDGIYATAQAASLPRSATSASELAAVLRLEAQAKRLLEHR